MGTPEFAVASLDALVKAKCNIVGVITAPDKPAGRGMKMTESAVKKICSSSSFKNITTGEIKEHRISQRASITKCRFANCRCIPNVARICLEHAATWYDQSSW